MLPSYIYYGVSSKEAVIVSKLGVPRFAVDNVLNILKEQHSNIDISIENYKKLKNIIEKIPSDQYQINDVSGEVIKSIIHERMKQDTVKTFFVQERVQWEDL